MLRAHCSAPELGLSAILVNRFSLQVTGPRCAQCALLAVLLTSLASTSGRAGESAAPTEVPLVQFLQRAATDNPYLAAGRIDIRAAQAGQDAVTGYRYGHIWGQMVTGPVPGATGQLTGTGKETPTSIPNYGYFFSNLRPYFRAELNVAAPLWTFGKIDAGAKAAGEQVEVKKAQSLEQTWEILTQIKSLYYGWILTEELDVLNDEIQGHLDEAGRYLEKHLTAGDADLTPIDRLKLKAYAAELETQRIEVKKRRQIAVDGLWRLTGLKADEQWRPAEHKLTQVGAAIDDNAAMMSLALSNQPEVSEVMHGVQALEAKRHYNLTRFFPELFIVATGAYAVAPNRDRQTNAFANDSFNYLYATATLGVNFDLQPGVASSELTQSDEELAALREKSLAVTSRVAHDVEAALAEVLADRDKVEVGKQAFQTTRAWSAYVMDAFDLGSITARELIDGLTAFVKARFMLLQDIYDYNIAVAQLSRTVGVELQPELKAAQAH